MTKVMDARNHEADLLMPRERLWQHGVMALSDAELLAILLRVGVSGVPVTRLAASLLNDFGTIQRLLASNPAKLAAVHGVGPAKACQLLAALELGRRNFAEPLKRGAVMDSPQAVRQFLCAELAAERREVFAALWLDAQHRLLRFERLFAGTIDSASVHPRVVVQQALEQDAAAVIFCHNHPSGVAEPSNADRQLTAQLQRALALIEVRVLDHLVVARGGIAVSMAERGQLITPPPCF